MLVSNCFFVITYWKLSGIREYLMLAFVPIIRRNYTFPFRGHELTLSYS